VVRPGSVRVHRGRGQEPVRLAVLAQRRCVDHPPGQVSSSSSHLCTVWTRWHPCRSACHPGCARRLCAAPGGRWTTVDGRGRVIRRPPWRRPASTSLRASSTVVHRPVHRC